MHVLSGEEATCQRTFLDFRVLRQSWLLQMILASSAVPPLLERYGFSNSGDCLERLTKRCQRQGPENR